jgi:AcrR family transcriptional regulator
MSANTNSRKLAPAKEQLLKAAERLFATKGLGAVSAREIILAAGQKNHSALSYHFGSFDAVLEAILNFRMHPLNERRQHILDTVKQDQGEQNLRCLVEVIVLPFAEELLRPKDQSYYLVLLSQLMSQGEWETYFTAHPQRSSALIETGELILSLLTKSIDEAIAIERLHLLGLHVIHSVTEWGSMNKRGELKLDQQSLSWRIENLIDYLTAALSAQCTITGKIN